MKLPYHHYSHLSTSSSVLLILTSLCLYHSFHYSGTVIDSCYNKLRSSSLISSSSSSSTTLYSIPSVLRSDENIANSTSSSGSLTISNGRKKSTSFLGKLKKKSKSTSSSTQQPISIPLSVATTVVAVTKASAAATGSTVISSRSSNKVDDVHKQEEYNIRSIDDLNDDDSDGNDDNINDNQHNGDARRIDTTAMTSVSTALLTLTDSSEDNTISIESLEDYLDFGDQHIGSYRDSSDSSRGISRRSSSGRGGGGGGGRDDDDRSVVDGGDEDIAEIIDLIDLRAEARFNRNYDEADRLRERLKRVGR